MFQCRRCHGRGCPARENTDAGEKRRDAGPDPPVGPEALQRDGLRRDRRGGDLRSRRGQQGRLLPPLRDETVRVPPAPRGVAAAARPRPAGCAQRGAHGRRWPARHGRPHAWRVLGRGRTPVDPLRILGAGAQGARGVGARHRAFPTLPRDVRGDRQEGHRRGVARARRRRQGGADPDVPRGRHHPAGRARPEGRPVGPGHPGHHRDARGRHGKETRHDTRHRCGWASRQRARARARGARRRACARWRCPARTARASRGSASRSCGATPWTPPRSSPAFAGVEDRVPPRGHHLDPPGPRHPHAAGQRHRHRERRARGPRSAGGTARLRQFDPRPARACPGASPSTSRRPSTLTTPRGSTTGPRPRRRCSCCRKPDGDWTRSSRAPRASSGRTTTASPRWGA